MSDVSEAQIFDRYLLRARRQRRAHSFGEFDFLKQEVAHRLDDRLRDVNRSFTVALDLGSGESVRIWTERLLQVGATCGADTGVGFFITVREGLAGRLKGCSPTVSAGNAVSERQGLWS